MSSILTALKKLENKDFHKEEISAISRSASNRYKKDRHDFAGFFSSGKFVLIFAGVLILGLVGWKSMDHQKKSESEEPILASKPPEMTKPALTAEGKPESRGLPASDIIQMPSQAPKNPPQDVSEKPSVSRQMTAYNKSSLKSRVQMKNTASETPVHPVSVPEDTDPVAPYLPRPYETDNTNPPKGQEELLLQAIAWAKVPEDRMAVINGEIVRQGELFKGTLIREINENDVVLKKEGYIWKLLFKIR